MKKKIATSLMIFSVLPVLVLYLIGPFHKPDFFGWYVIGGIGIFGYMVSLVMLLWDLIESNKPGAYVEWSPRKRDDLDSWYIVLMLIDILFIAINLVWGVVPSLLFLTVMGLVIVFYGFLRFMVS